MNYCCNLGDRSLQASISVVFPAKILETQIQFYPFQQDLIISTIVSKQLKEARFLIWKFQIIQIQLTFSRKIIDRPLLLSFFSHCSMLCSWN